MQIRTVYIWAAPVTRHLVYFTFPDHPLLDIRSRSLRSVSFKLSTGLLHIADMVHERDFLSHLLEWFNFEEVVMEAQALSLISQVAEVRTIASYPDSSPRTPDSSPDSSPSTVQLLLNEWRVVSQSRARPCDCPTHKTRWPCLLTSLSPRLSQIWRPGTEAQL